MQTICLVSPFLSTESLGFLLLSEQGDQGGLSGGEVEVGALVERLQGGRRAALELGCVLST